MTKPLVGVIGGEGFLGRALVKHFDAVSITHNEYGEPVLANGNSGVTVPHYDLLINANGNASKWWALRNPIFDWEASVTSVYESLVNFKYTNYAYMSSVDAGRKSVYGLHKNIAEKLVRQYARNHHILRLTALVGPGASKGPIFDLMNGREMYISPDSYLQFISTKDVASVLNSLILSRIKDITCIVGGRGTTTMRYLEEFTKKSPRYKSGCALEQYRSGVPTAEAVFPALRSSNYYAEEEVFRYEGMAKPV